MKIEWTSDYITGISLIDSEHRSLVELINAIEEARAKSSDTEPVVEGAIGKLLDYTLNHFQHEEELMTNAQYPNFAAHKETHDELRQFATHLYDRYSRGEDVLTQLLDTLNKWLITHIMGSDKKFVEVVKIYLAKQEQKTF